MKFHVLKQGEPHEGLVLENFMFEDKSQTDMSYVDYLCYIHKEIQNELSN